MRRCRRSPPEERLGLALMPVGGDPEDRRLGRERAPERALTAAQAPAGLVDVDGGCAADLVVQPGVGRCERLAGALHDRVDRARGELGAEQLAHELHRVAAGDAVAHGDDRGLQPRPERGPANAGRKLGPRLGGAGGAAQPVQAMLGDYDRERWQLGDLVALRGGRVDALVLADAMRAGVAALRPVLVDLVHPLERKQQPVRTHMPRLTAAAATLGDAPVDDGVADPLRGQP